MPESYGARVRAGAITALGYVVGVSCLVWVFRDLQWLELADSFRGVQWWWATVAVGLTLLVYVLIAWEWQWLLKPVGHLAVGKLARAVFAGRFANDVLPVHIGYVFRLYLVSRWMPASVPAIIPSLLVERVCEAFWLSLAVALTALFLPLPKPVLEAAGVLVAVLASGAVVAIFLTAWRRRQIRLGRNTECRDWASRLSRLLHQLLSGFQAIARSRFLPVVLGLSLLKLVIQGLAFASVLWAYGFNLPAPVQVAVFLIACIGVSLPSTPASAGVFQLFCVAGLTSFGVPKPAATGFSLLAFVLLTAPPALAGLLSLTHSGITWHALRRETAHLRCQMDSERGP